MTKYFLILAGALAFAVGHARSEVVIADVYARQTTSLNDKWRVIVDPYDTGFYDYRRQPYDAE